MPLRPIDAIFVHPKRRLYVVYYRGELWQLPRMKIDDRSWQNRQPYTDDSRSLYLSIHQAINDPILAQKLRTLNLPVAVRGARCHALKHGGKPMVLNGLKTSLRWANRHWLRTK